MNEAPIRVVLNTLLRGEEEEVIVNASVVTTATTNNTLWQHKISAMHINEAFMVVYHFRRQRHQ